MDPHAASPRRETDPRPPMPLTPGRTALVVVDMQNAFLEPEGSCARLGLDHGALRESLAGVEALVGAARRERIPIVFTRYAYRPDYGDGGIVIDVLLPGLRDAGALIDGSWDAELVAELAPRHDEAVIAKNRPSAFHATGLQNHLDALGVDSLVVCGVTTNVCVESTVRDAMQRDYRVWVVSDAVAEFEADRHTVALKAMAWMFASLVDLESALATLPQLAGPKAADPEKEVHHG